jgi:hypothetical protein
VSVHTGRKAAGLMVVPWTIASLLVYGQLSPYTAMAMPPEQLSLLLLTCIQQV